MDFKDWSCCSFEEGRQTLRSWREENIRRSEESVEIWEHVISRKPSSLGDELWVVYEQVFVAALDCARLDVAQECIAALHNKFPKSHRVLKLEAMRLEAIGKYEDALKIYDSLIKKDEANATFRKRRAAVYKGQGRIAEAINEINEYLTRFLNDTEAWLELSELFLAEQEYARAAFCIEELILSNPHNHLFHQKYAEIKYTQGGLENLELAKSYFAEAVKLNANNMRALFGLFLCCQNLAQGGKATGPKRKDCLKLASWCSEQILQKYSTEACGNSDIEPIVKALDSMFKTVHLNAASSSSGS